MHPSPLFMVRVAKEAPENIGGNGDDKNERRRKARHLNKVLSKIFALPLRIPCKRHAARVCWRQTLASSPLKPQRSVAWSNWGHRKIYHKTLQEENREPDTKQNHSVFRQSGGNVGEDWKKWGNSCEMRHGCITEQHGITFHGEDHAVCWQGQYITIDTQQDRACPLFFFFFFFISANNKSSDSFNLKLFEKDKQMCVFHLGYNGAFSSVCSGVLIAGEVQGHLQSAAEAPLSKAPKPPKFSDRRWAGQVSRGGPCLMPECSWDWHPFPWSLKGKGG